MLPAVCSLFAVLAALLITPATSLCIFFEPTLDPYVAYGPAASTVATPLYLDVGPFVSWSAGDEVILNKTRAAGHWTYSNTTGIITYSSSGCGLSLSLNVGPSAISKVQPDKRQTAIEASIIALSWGNQQNTKWIYVPQGSVTVLGTYATASSASPIPATPYTTFLACLNSSGSYVLYLLKPTASAVISYPTADALGNPFSACHTTQIQVLV